MSAAGAAVALETKPLIIIVVLIVIIIIVVVVVIIVIVVVVTVSTFGHKHTIVSIQTGGNLTKQTPTCVPVTSRP